MKVWLVRIGIGAGLLVAVLALTGLILIYTLNFHPTQKMDAELVCGNESNALQPGAKLRLLSWNIQYAASRKYHFFYDDGQAVHPALEDVKAITRALGEAVRKYNPDLILWQEIDRDSARTGRIDQLKQLLAAKQYSCWAATPYHRSAYVPSPAQKHLGRVDMQLAVFSRFPIASATRHALPMLDESFLRRAFNLKRAVLEVRIPIQGRPNPLVLFDTHFSAFSFGDGTMRKQVQLFQALLQGAETAGNPWVAAGDLNLLPPGDNPGRLGKDKKYYPETDTPLKLLFDDSRIQPALSLEAYRNAPERYNTYLPFGAEKADRWIDHVFVGGQVKVGAYTVLNEYKDLSDHLPILLEVTLP